MQMSFFFFWFFLIFLQFFSCALRAFSNEEQGIAKVEFERKNTDRIIKKCFISSLGKDFGYYREYNTR